MSEREDVILVAVTVTGEPSRDASQDYLIEALGRIMSMDGRGVTEFWVAEDDRRDRSDNDSAVFCHLGSQRRAHAQLLDGGLTADHNYPPAWV